MRMKASRKISLCLFLAFAGFAYASPAQEFGLELGVEHFRWREYEAGARLLEETGPRYRLGGQLRTRLDPAGRDALELRGGVYFGDIDYDGQACNLAGDCTPFQTSADYRGAFIEGLFAHRPTPASGVELFAGGGIDGWQREIQGRGSVIGVEEHWTVFYALGGAGVGGVRNSVRYQARAGLKFPFYTDESAEDLGVTLNPDGELSYFARLSAEFLERGRPQWSLGFYYDSFRFDASDPEVTGNIVVFQPESRQDTIGLYTLIYLR